MTMTRWALFAAGLLAACGNDSPSNPSTDATGGKRHVGGASSRAGAAGLGGRVGAAGTSANGGTLAIAGSSPIGAIGAAAGEPNTSLAGAASTGGITGASGTTNNAGNGNGGDVAGAPMTATGGAANGGAAAGGSTEIGGTSTAAGGAAAGSTAATTGGNLSAGGATSTGGALPTGGSVTTGGTTATGGAVSTGGTPASTGGTTATGGVPATGGAGTCTINSVVYQSGIVSPDSPCLSCQPAISTVAWAPIADGTSCPGGKICHSGSCKLGCIIGSAFQPDGTVKPSEVCQTCQPAVSTTAWSPLTEGTSCGTGQYCHSGVCLTGCWIGSTYYAADASNPDDGCQACKPATSTTSWTTTLAEGDSCATGQVCHNDTCQPGCWIGSTYYATDTVRPNGPCQACKPATSTTAWTSDAEACGCLGLMQGVQESTGLCVAVMAPIPGPTTDTNYSIDRTEVTRKQYAMWLATTNAATLSAQDAATCSWNTDFAASSSCMASSYVCKTECDNHPQVCVDWCDAYAYCKGVGKRLCGKIGGGPNEFSDYASANLSEWYRACSSGGSFTYPYGNTYNGTICNGYDYWGSESTMTTLDVASLNCVAAAPPYYGVFDLSGNVREWEDSCDSTTIGTTANCRTRGGSYRSYNGTDLPCGKGYADGRNLTSYSAGLRCCSP
jgi:formylglycine-generating enzyme